METQTSFTFKPAVGQRVQIVTDLITDTGTSCRGAVGRITRLHVVDGWQAAVVRLDDGETVSCVFGVDVRPAVTVDASCQGGVVRRCEAVGRMGKQTLVRYTINDGQLRERWLPANRVTVVGGDRDQLPRYVRKTCPAVKFPERKPWDEAIERECPKCGNTHRLAWERERVPVSDDEAREVDAWFERVGREQRAGVAWDRQTPKPEHLKNVWCYDGTYLRDIEWATGLQSFSLGTVRVD